MAKKEKINLPKLLDVAEIIAITSGDEEDLEWADRFRKASADAAKLIKAANNLCSSMEYVALELPLHADVVADHKRLKSALSPFLPVIRRKP